MLPLNPLRPPNRFPVFLLLLSPLPPLPLNRILLICPYTSVIISHSLALFKVDFLYINKMPNRSFPSSHRYMSNAYILHEQSDIHLLVDKRIGAASRGDERSVLCFGRLYRSTALLATITPRQKRCTNAHFEYYSSLHATISPFKNWYISM